MKLCEWLFQVSGQVLYCGKEEALNNLPFEWSGAYVLLSLVICIIYSGIACDMYARTSAASPDHLNAVIKTGAIYGLGIFSMHFVGMYALLSPGPMEYDFFITAFSLVVAISGTTLTMSLHNQRNSLFLAAVIFGLTICSMHYAGMLSIVANPYYMHHQSELLLIAVLYSIAGSYLSLMFFTKYIKRHSKKNLMISATTMGLTISGMHYLAMAAMDFTPADAPPLLAHSFYIDRETIIMFTIFMLLLTIIVYINDSIDSERNLKIKKHELEVSNKSISSTLNKLKNMQTQLIESEKMASLGQLVTGVAHEINTPVGICITSASYLDEKSKNFFNRYEKKELARQDFEKYMNAHQSSSKLIIENLYKASDLIRSFKQVAVDQNAEEPRAFFIGQYIQEVLASLNHKIKNTQYKINIDCEKDFQITTYAGPLSTLLTHLINNSLMHGFEEKEEGLITIKVSEEGQNVLLEYSDNGCGMSQDDIDHIFNPFFTTKRAQGCCGLGMHIVYNQVTQKLGGKLDCHSLPEQGIHVSIRFPKHSNCEILTA